MSMKNLYQEVILKHFKAPHHFGDLSEGETMASVDNPSCGDQFSISIDLKENIVSDIVIDGSGCAISVASCSLMSDMLIGMKKEAADQRITAAMNALNGRSKILEEEWGDFAAFDGVRNFKARRNCALLAWRLAAAALSPD